MCKLYRSRNSRAFIAFLCIFLCSLSVFAQVDLKSYVNTVPPNIASFQKYSNTPVNYSTGQISENINLFTLDIDANLRIPINLMYSNSGLKPDAVPSWVGNGWDLMPGGFITQEVRGMDDMMPGGLARTPAAKQKIENYMNGLMTNANENYTYIKNALKGIEDTQADLFTLNLMGKTVPFYLDGTTVRLVNQEPVKIELYNTTGFIVTDEKGYQYQFLDVTASSGTLTDDLYESPGATGSKSWGLNKIVTPNNDVVTFNYVFDASYLTKNTSTTFTWGATVGKYSDNEQPPWTCIPQVSGPNYSYSTASIVQSILSSIVYKGRTVSFETSSRNDLNTDPASQTAAKALASIKVRNERNDLIKNIQFQYTNGQRLKLNEVDILDAKSLDLPQSYKFEYYDYFGTDVSKIPLITSTSRVTGLDYWGYYNGIDGNSSSSISDIDYSIFFPGMISRYGHNDHNANGAFSMIGMLKKITYPTGGYTTYEYEPNKMIYPNYYNINHFYRSDVTPVYTEIVNRSLSCVDDGSSSSQGDEVGIFTVGSNPNISLDWSLLTDDDRDHGTVQVRKQGSAEYLINIYDKTSAGSKQFNLPPGTYEYHLNITCDFVRPTDRNIVHFVASSFVYPTNIPVTVGGNRILRIKDYDKTGVVALTRKILYSDVVMNQEPNYFDQYNAISEPGIQSGYPDLTCGPINVIGERDIYQLPGFLLTYKKVTELFGENGENGKTEYYYEGTAYTGSPNYAQNPYPPVVHLSWRDQDLQKKVIYKRSGQDFVKRQSTAYTFTPTPVTPLQQSVLKGLKFGVQARVVLGNEKAENYKKYFSSGSIFYPTDRHAELTITDELFNDDGTSVNTTTSYTYTSQDFLLASEKQTNPQGKLTEKLTWYPNDYDNISNIEALKTGHFIGLPVKEISTVDGKIMEGKVYTRDNKGNISQLHRYENASLQVPPAHSAGTFYPAGFNPKVQLSYDGSNHLSQYVQQDNTPVAVLWGYNGTYPIVEVKNATYQDLLNVLGQQTVDRLAGNNPGTDLEVRSLLNALRTQLSNSQVTTYTYDPLIGMTSMTDAKGYTTYYEYDGLQRLINVKDQNGNILKHTDYHYQGQLSN